MHGLLPALKNLLVAFLILPQAIVAHARTQERDSSTLQQRPEFSWTPTRRLTWEDFQGPVPPLRGTTAAQTSCGFGFATNSVRPGERVEVTVYNAFRPERSWVHPDHRTPYVLAHEQAHFDLCEIYTRHLYRRFANTHLRAENLKDARRIYSEVMETYRARQESYDQECRHGLDEAAQARWLAIIAKELEETSPWAYR